MNNGNEPPARMQTCLSPGRETEFIWSGLMCIRGARSSLRCPIASEAPIAVQVAEAHI